MSSMTQVNDDTLLFGAADDGVGKAKHGKARRHFLVRPRRAEAPFAWTAAAQEIP
jgi:hypothetical protein